MATRRYVTEAPRITAAGNADLDIVVTLREAVPADSIDDVTAAAPQLGDLVDLTGFTNLRGQLRAERAVAGLTSGSVTDNTPRATMSVAILGFPADGQLRCRVTAARMWAMQQAGVRGGYFDLIGTDAEGVTWSLIIGGLFILLPGATPPFANSADDPGLLPADRFPSANAVFGSGNLEPATSTSSSGGEGGVTDHGELTGLAEDDHPQYMTSARVASYLAGATLDATHLSGLVPNASISAGSVTQHTASIITSIDSALGGTTWQLGGGGGSMTGAEILAALLTVDVDDSGLNADTLDSQEGAYYRDASNLNAGEVPDTQISETSVTQHEAALSIATTQLTGTITPTQTKIAGWTLTKPAAYPPTPPILPRRTIRGWMGNVSARSLRTVTGGTSTYYVDAAKGSNANIGSAAAPFRSVWYALNQSDVGVVKVAPGVYTLQDTWQTPTYTISITNAYAVERWPVRSGEVILTTAKHNPTWTLASLYSTCTTSQDVQNVVDIDVKAEDGGYATYEQVTSSALCDAQPGSWYHDTGANTLYVHPLRPGVPGRSVLVMEGAYNGAVDSASRRTIYMEGLTFIGGASGFVASNNTGSAGGQVVAVRCNFHNSAVVGFRPTGYATVVTEDCRAMRNRNDGFSYVLNGSTGTTNAVEVRNEYAWNGYFDGNDAANGSSVHDGMAILRIGCKAWMNMGPQWADVNASTFSWNVGCDAGQSAAFDEDTQACGFQVLGGATMYLYDCTSRVNLYDVVVGTGSSLYQDQCEFAVVSNSGTSSTYTQT